MTNIIKDIRQRARERQKLIILPEKDDSRIQAAAKIAQKENIVRLLLLGKKDLEPQKIDEFAEAFFELRKHKGVSLEDARKIMAVPLYYAAMLVRNGEADGFVAGVAHSTPDVARAAIYCLGVDERIKTASSCFIMVVADCALGENGVFVFADCGIVPEPTSAQLAQIAISSSELAQNIFGITPRVAMLSYSTKGSAKGPLVDKVKEATQLAKQINPHILIDGELQLDAAIIPEVARIKDPQGPLAGRANVLIFPGLEAGNIGYKLVQRLAKARAIGPLLQGLNKPCSDLSRGATVNDIVDTIAATALRA
jgi:phosphate acetyltransferase